MILIPKRRPLSYIQSATAIELASAIINLLKNFHMEVLVDVRSSPYSLYCPQFNRETFEKNLKTAGLDYLFFGDRLGGRPKDPDVL